MNSLIHRLRMIALHHTRPGLVPDVMREAADRIDQLETALLGATAWLDKEALDRGEALKRQIREGQC